MTKLQRVFKPSSLPRLSNRQIQKRGLQRQHLLAIMHVALLDAPVFALVEAQHIHRSNQYVRLLTAFVLLERKLGAGSRQLPKLDMLGCRVALFSALEVNI